MKRIDFTALSVSATLALIFTLSAIPAGAQQHRRHEEDRCQDPIRASGEVRATNSRALNSAWNQWKQQVREAYGLEYAQREAAIKISEKCFDATVHFPLQRQCRIVAKPCLVKDEREIRSGHPG